MATRQPSRNVTSSRVASAATKVLRDSRTSKAAKTAAGSALTQRPGRAKAKNGQSTFRTQPESRPPRRG